MSPPFIPPCVLQCEIMDHFNAPHLDRYVERLVEARKKKNLTPEGARDLLHDANYFGTVNLLPKDLNACRLQILAASDMC